MIALSGRVIPGLDEFMLRLGHLKVLSQVAKEEGGARHRVEKSFMERLTTPSIVEEAQVGDVAQYLGEKKLCRITANLDDAKSRESKSANGVRNVEQTQGAVALRYPALEVTEDNGLWSFTDKSSDIRIWWQDLCLADPSVSSKVGSVASGGKAGSKKGSSHILDWAELLGILSKTAQVSPEARLLVSLGVEDASGVEWSRNPYVLQNDRLILGFLLISADMDAFGRMMGALKSASWPLKKRQATEVFLTAMEGMAEEAEKSSILTSGEKFHIYQQFRELKKANRQSDDRLSISSTAWHRTASRMESYVDLGILSKGAGGAGERFEYVYYPAAPLKKLADSLEAADDVQRWIEEQLVDCLSGVKARSTVLPLADIGTALRRILQVLASPVTSYSLDALAVGLVKIFADEGEPISIGCARRSLEELARQHPEIARLARGTHGQRAEFISIAAAKLYG